MDAKQEFNKFVTEFSRSARELASQGLSAGAKALEVTATALQNAKQQLETRAAKVKPEQTAPADEPKQA